MVATGLDLGGTKIEAQVFDTAWNIADRKRVATPASYDDLINTIVDLIRWGDGIAGRAMPVGIGAAGLIHPVSGRALTANLNATGKMIPADIIAAVGRPVTYLNDSRAMALAEAVFGAGRTHRTVMSVIMGTGVGGGIVVDGALLVGPTATGGEFGHCAAPAGLVSRLGLPVFACGCGGDGCIETYISGTGLVAMSEALIGRPMAAPDIASARNGVAAPVWDAWCALTGNMLRNLILTVDPDVIVLGGGLSKINGGIDAVTAATQAAQIGDFTIPPIVAAQGGDASGVRGAAWAAVSGAKHGATDG